MRVQFGEWIPDQPAIGVNHLRVAHNVLPRTNLAYAPFPSLGTSFSSLPSRVTGAFAARKANGIIQLFAGTQTKLYETLVGPSWTDATNVGGDYESFANPWKFEELKYRVFATNYEDPIQTFLLGVDTKFSDLSVAAPKAKYLKSWFPGFLAVAYTNDAVDGERPSRVWWPAFGDPTDWPVPGSADAEAKQSNFVDLTKGGLITGLTGPVGGASGSVFCQTAIYRVDYEGPPTIYRIVDVEVDRGTNAPQSIVSIGNRVYYLGNDGFYMFDGVQSTPIGSQRVDKTFYNELDQGFMDRIFGVADPINKIVLWLYCVSGSGGVPSKVLAFNWETGRWTSGEMSADIIAQFYTPSYTIDSIDSFGDLDTITPSFDSRAWEGGSQSLVAFNSNHTLAFFTDNYLEAQIETGDLALEDGAKFRCKRVRPFVDGPGVSVRTGTSSEQINGDEAPVYTDWATTQRDGTAIIRTRDRFTRFGLKIPAGVDWTHASGFDINGKQGGI